jgi:hypothetical protein
LGVAWVPPIAPFRILAGTSRAASTFVFLLDLTGDRCRCVDICKE